MYDNRRMRFFPTQPEIDIYQIIREAQNRWLRPLEVIEILRNYQKFRLNPVPPNKPPSGSLFLFDRKTLRFFRKDGHNWRKKKDGKTVREAHERLKAGSVDVLHCYYAHGEDNPNFQRRSYWMLEGAYEHIVLVHYREVTEGSRSSVYRSMQEAKENASQSTAPRPSRLPASSPGISDAEVTGPYKSPEAPVTPLESEGTDSGGEEGDANGRHPDVVVDHHSSLLQQVSHVKEEVVTTTNAACITPKPPVTPAALENVDFDDLLRNPDAYLNQKTISPAVTLDLSAWNTLLENYKTTSSQPFASTSFANHDTFQAPKLPESHQMDVDARLLAQGQYVPNEVYQKPQTSEYRLPLPEADNSLKKLDSFGRWMSREIGDDSQSSLLSGSTEHNNAYWTLEDHNTFDEISSFTQQMNMDVGLGPSLSQEQQFSIVDFSPDWAFATEETKIIVAGNFLKGSNNPTWFCMFGELEVPAEIIHDGVLRCKAPPHSPGRVPLYITRGNRIACSEIREFEYRRPASSKLTPEVSPGPMKIEDRVLQLRLAKLISIYSDDKAPGELGDEARVSKILELTSCLEKESPGDDEGGRDVGEIVLEMLLRQQLQRWLLVKLAENEEKGASVLDSHGQCALHLASALGYGWAVNPILAAGVGINFRDSHGWTALHWAASRGREAVVSTLLAAGASPGLVTDPTPQFSSGRTPADLAASSGHKGMAGLLAEMSLTSHLTTLTLKEGKSRNEMDSFSAVMAEEKAVELISDSAESEKVPGDVLLQGSLRAVRNAARAAALIHASFRQESFRKRQEKLDEEVDEYGLSMSDVKTMASSLHPERSGGGSRKERLHSAATKIQQKYRGWKGRKDFLLLRQRVVKIQAHFRGHQVRRKFNKLLWTVGILDKAVLRWRRKRSGLRNFKPAAEVGGGEEDDDDVLKAGRKQKEAQIQKAVTRVQSMVRSHDAREQYQRIQEAYLQAVAGETSQGDAAME